MKICIVCKKDNQKFEKGKNSCTSCRYQQRKKRNVIHSVCVAEKECFTCKITKPATDFYKSKRLATGLMTNCKDCKKAHVKKQYENNKDYIKTRTNKYYHDNKKELRPKRQAYQNFKEKTDPKFKLARKLRGRLYDALRMKSWKKNTSFYQYIGCTLEELKVHLETQFTDGMTWENHGKWHIDHITPLASAETEQDLYDLCHYTNLQPLWATDNLKKGSK